MSDQHPDISRFHCKHCNGLNLFPRLHPQSETTGKAEIVQATIADLLAWLTRNTKDPATIGKRVQQLEFAMKANHERGALLTFAQQQKISSAGASRAVAEAEGQLQKLRSVTKDSTAATSG